MAMKTFQASIKVPSKDKDNSEPVLLNIQSDGIRQFWRDLVDLGNMYPAVAKALGKLTSMDEQREELTQEKTQRLERATPAAAAAVERTATPAPEADPDADAPTVMSDETTPACPEHGIGMPSKKVPGGFYCPGVNEADNTYCKWQSNPRKPAKRAS